MTDTTAPDAITQAKSLDDQVAPFVEAYEFRYDDGGGYTPHDADRAMLEDAIHGFIADHVPPDAHRRLAAHGAGEGLREALIRVARMIPNVLCDDRVSDAFLTSIPDELAHYTITRTPPPDAGSTTHEGGEGVREVLTALFDAGFELAEGKWHLGVPWENWANGKRDAAVSEAIAALATASSPDASRDEPNPLHERLDSMVADGLGITGGGAEYWRMRAAVVDAIERTLSPAASPDSGEIVTDAMRRAGGLAINPDEDVLSVTGHEAELAYRAMRLAASPASLSGGAEEVERLAVGVSDKVIMQLGIAEDDPRLSRIIDELRDDLAALAPSPEAPANRQEAGE